MIIFLNKSYILFNYIICGIYNFLIYSKYLIYFNLFLFFSNINIIYYKLNNNLNSNLIFLLNWSINLNGCILIKFIQWIFSNYKLTKSQEEDNIFKIFYKFYEHCDTHNLKYTKKIFKKEYHKEFDDYFLIDSNTSIKSGSIAQVYKCYLKQDFYNYYKDQTIAFKIVHPEVVYQMYFPLKFIKLLYFCIRNINFLNKYDLPFDTNKFLTGITKQIDLNNEFNNIKNFYEYHKNNSCIIIPEPITSSKSILIMQYVEGKYLSDIDLSFYYKQKIITFLSLFIKYCYYFSDIIHCDLHDANWKVVESNGEYKIVIYDFGYVIENNDNIKNFLKNLIYNTDFGNKKEVGEIIYSLLEKPTIFNNFDNFYSEYLSVCETCSYYGDDLLATIYKYSLKKNLKFSNPVIFELIMSILLIREYLQKYLFNNKTIMEFKKKDSKENINIVFTVSLGFHICCKENNIYPEVRDYLEEYYFNSPQLKEIYQYNSNYYEDINVEESIDI